MKKSKLEYEDYWFNYVLKTDPNKIKAIIKEEYIESDNLKIHLDIYDNERSLDKTIIFIHGTSVYSRFYAEFCYNLYTKGYQIVAPDMIGHGLSEGVRGHFTMNEYTKTIYNVSSYIIDNYNDNIIVMGSSLGGITSLYCAANDNRLKGAICHNVAIFNEEAHKKIIRGDKRFEDLKAKVPKLAKISPKFKASVLSYLDFSKLAKSKKMQDVIDVLLKDKILALKYTLTSLMTQMTAPLSRPVEKIEIPVMIINGNEDILFSVDYMKEIFNRLTCEHKKLEIIEGASHLILQENINDVISCIIPWIEKVLY